MKTIGEIRTKNINLLVNQYGGFKGLGERLGRARAQIEQWARNYKDSNGKPRYISDGSCRFIEKTLGLQHGWLDQEHPEQFEIAETPATYLIPAKPTEAVFGVLDVKAACGSGVVNPDRPETIRQIIMPVEDAMKLIGSANRNGQIKVIIAIKDSMTPTINPNDMLFVDMSVTEFAGEAVYILLHAGELICKRLQMLGKHLTVISDNRNYESWRWEDKPDETRIVGKVLRVLPLHFKILGN